MFSLLHKSPLPCAFCYHPQGKEREQLISIAYSIDPAMELWVEVSKISQSA